MKSRTTLGFVVTIIVAVAIMTLWGFDGLAVYLAIKIVALILLWFLWGARRRLAGRAD